MKLKPSDVLNFKVTPIELMLATKKCLSEQFEPEHFDPEDCSFKFEEKVYSFLQVERGDLTDEGKYSYSVDTYQLVSYCNSTMDDKYDLFFHVNYSRTGDYYSDYYYDYEQPEFLISTIVEIPEIVVPAHQKVELNKIELEEI
jgi:hypothetical protein